MSGGPPLALLTPFERASFHLMDLLARHGRGGVDIWLRTVGKAWVWAGIGKVLSVRGLERLESVRPDDGVLLVSNHRSFFDLYVLSMILYRFTKLRQAVFCPVRADFFYQRPLGIVVNLLAGGGRMYPPVFREPHKADFNKWAVSRVAGLLRDGGVMVGMHPEGTRNKNVDPYTSLRAQPGVGKLVMDSWPVVIPAFINGLSNDLVGEVRSNFAGNPGKQVIAVFGEPIDLAPFQKMTNRLVAHKRVADRVLERVYLLGDEERQLRAKLPL